MDFLRQLKFKYFEIRRDARGRYTWIFSDVQNPMIAENIDLWYFDLTLDNNSRGAKWARLSNPVRCSGSFFRKDSSGHFFFFFLTRKWCLACSISLYRRSNLIRRAWFISNVNVACTRYPLEIKPVLDLCYPHFDHQFSLDRVQTVRTVMACILLHIHKLSVT